MSVLPPQRPALIIFDWDDTLVDNYAAIHAAINAARAAYALPIWTLAETRANCRIALKEIFPIWFGAEWEKAQDIFYQTFAACHIEFLNIKAGAPALLQALQAAGIQCAINSNKKSLYLREEIAHLGWQDYFAAVVGAGDVPRGKPAPDGVLALCHACGLAAGAALWFVGDNQVDIATAQAAGALPVLIAEVMPTPDAAVAQFASLADFHRNLALLL